MPVVYEHWRPDTNECFYVGMSTHVDEKAMNRAKCFDPRNPHHKSVVAKLRKSNLKPLVKIIATYDDVESAYALEKMKILYWRALLGVRLTNKTVGGEGAGSGADHPSFGIRGELHQSYGKVPWNKGLPTEKQPRFGVTGDKHPMFGRRGSKHPCFGKVGYWAGKVGPWAGIKGDNAPASKINQMQAEEIRTLALIGDMKQKQIADLYGISVVLVKRIKANRAWPS